MLEFSDVRCAQELCVGAGHSDRICCMQRPRAAGAAPAAQQMYDPCDYGNGDSEEDTEEEEPAMPPAVASHEPSGADGHTGSALALAMVSTCMGPEPQQITTAAQLCRSTLAI